jgi:hypothetical protein
LLRVEPLTEFQEWAAVGYVHVASYDGGQFDPNLLLEDRQAIATVQNGYPELGQTDDRVQAL